MDPDDPSSIYYFVLVLLLLCSGFYAGAEVALISMSPAKARFLTQQKKRGSLAMDYLKKNPEKLLITVLVMNNIVNIVIPVLATVIFTQIFGNQILGLLTGVLTLLMIIFGEIVPKTFAQKHSEAFGLFSAPIIFWNSKIIAPIIWLISRLLKLLGANQTSVTFSDEELIALAEIGEEEGVLESDERNRIEGVLEFGDTTAEEVMTARPDMDMLSDTKTIAEAVDFFLEKTHSRIPVYRDTIDDIVGILTLKNILKFQRNFPKNTPLSKLPTQAPLTIPISMALEDVLNEMKWRRTHMAIVIDEHGGTAGLVTLEDLLEEVFGEIEDETDREEPIIKKLPDKSFLVRGSAEISEVTDATGFHIPGEEGERMAKVILDALGRFPKRGESIAITDHLIGIVEKMHGHKIQSIRLFRKK